MASRRLLLVPPLLLITVLGVATLGYMLIEGWGFRDSLYEAAIIVSTVGLKEVRRMGEAGETWTLIVIIFGVFTIAVAYGIMTTTIVSGELRRAMGRRTLQSKIKQLSGHIIVCGYGRMGQSAVEQLERLGVKVVVIDHDVNRTTELEERGILYVLGDASEEELLQQAGITRAKGLIAALSEDSANVFVTLTARGLAPDLKIAARAEQPSTEPKLYRAGADRVICPAVIGATRVANVLVRPHVADFIETTFKGVELELEEFRVPANSSLVDKTLREAPLRQKANVMVVAIRHGDGQTAFNPGADEQIREGDTLILIGPSGAVSRVDAVLGEG
jgi:voltage-gated potassium channel